VVPDGGRVVNWREEAQRQLVSFEASRPDWWAQFPRWFYVSGGRAAHGFVGEEEAPACGVRPLRADGTAAPWRRAAVRDSLSTGSGVGRRVRCAACVRDLLARGVPSWRL
jgi:hypothetical protein